MKLTTEQLDELEAALDATESPAIIVGRDHLRNIIAAARREKKLREALERSRIAIDDWLNIYAADQCDEKRVKEAMARVGEFGTLAYIADVQQQNREALKDAP